jgi:putative DNA primase/helicase
MATNHKPNITGTDHGIWRRIRLIPFNTTIKEEDRDINLYEKLIEEAPGILNWLIKGAMRWKVERLALPVEVKSATDEYREEMDIIGNFLKDRCEEKLGAQIGAHELFTCYQDWCEESNEYAQSERFLGLRLAEMGMKKKRISSGNLWLNIAIRVKE